MEPEKKQLGRWLEDVEMILGATAMSHVYIPTVREEWIKAVQQKPTPILQYPENLPKQPNTGRERLIRSHWSAQFCFELSGNSN